MTILKVTLQQRTHEPPLSGVQRKPWNQHGEMPPEFCLASFGHQAQQLFFVGSQKFGQCARDFFSGVCSAHSYQRIIVPQTGDQGGEEPWILQHPSCYLVGATDGAAVASLKKREDVGFWHVANDSDPIYGTLR